MTGVVEQGHFGAARAEFDGASCRQVLMQAAEMDQVHGESAAKDGHDGQVVADGYHLTLWVRSHDTLHAGPGSLLHLSQRLAFGHHKAVRCSHPFLHQFAVLCPYLGYA